jgi:hypothetical protein
LLVFFRSFILFIVTMQTQHDFQTTPLFLPLEDYYEQHEGGVGGSSLVDDHLQGPFLSTPSPTPTRTRTQHLYLSSCNSSSGNHNHNNNMTAYHHNHNHNHNHHGAEGSKVTLHMLLTSPQKEEEEEHSAACRRGPNHHHSNGALYYSARSMQEPIDLHQHQHHRGILTFSNKSMTGRTNSSLNVDNKKMQEPSEHRHRHSTISSKNSNVTAAMSTVTDLNTVNLDDDDSGCLTLFLTPLQQQQPKPKPSSNATGVVGMSRVIPGFTDTFGTPGIAATLFTKNPSSGDSGGTSVMYAKSSSGNDSTKENEEQVLTSSTCADRGSTTPTSMPSPTNMVFGVVIDSAPAFFPTSPQADSDSSSSTLYPKSYSSVEVEEQDMMSPMTDVTLTWPGPLLAPKPRLSSAMMMAIKKKGPGVLLVQDPVNKVLPNEIAVFNTKHTLSNSNNQVERLDNKVALLQAYMTEIQDTVTQSLMGMKVQMAPVEDATNRNIVLEKRMEGLEQALHLTKKRLDRLEEQGQLAFQVAVVTVLAYFIGTLLQYMMR